MTSYPIGKKHDEIKQKGNRRKKEKCSRTITASSDKYNSKKRGRTQTGVGVMGRSVERGRRELGRSWVGSVNELG